MQKDITADQSVPVERPAGQVADKGDTTSASQEISEHQADAAYEEYKTCENCATRLHGPFCATCGQKDVDFLRPLWMLIEDALADLVSFDSRFYRTIFPLMCKPGHITSEYLKGRRVSFVPPFRQYLVVSLVFFLSLATSDIRLIEAEAVDWDPMTEYRPTATQEEAPETEPSEPTSAAAETEAHKTIQELNEWGDWRQPTSKFIHGWNRISEDPAIMNKLVAEWIPRLMFVLLPVYAFLFEVVYIFRKRFFFEHLIFSLHAHAFVFLLLAILVLLYQLVPVLRPVLPWVLLYVPVYLLIAMKRVYRQGWFKTIFKAGLIAFFYFILLLTGSVSILSYGVMQV